jgi:hypothetical protein
VTEYTTYKIQNLPFFENCCHPEVLTQLPLTHSDFKQARKCHTAARSLAAPFAWIAQGSEFVASDQFDVAAAVLFLPVSARPCFDEHLNIFNIHGNNKQTAPPVSTNYIMQYH